VWLFGLPGYFPLVLFSVPGMFFFFKERDEDRVVKYFSFYFLFLLTAYWFGTSSLSRFAPIPLFERMWMMLLAPACVLTAFGLKKIGSGEENKFTGVMFFLFLATSAIAFAFVSANRALFFFLFALMIAGIYFTKGKIKLPEIQKVALAIFPWFVLLVWFIAHNSRWVTGQ
jgi:hypothetical protein